MSIFDESPLSEIEREVQTDRVWLMQLKIKLDALRFSLHGVEQNLKELGELIPGNAETINAMLQQLEPVRNQVIKWHSEVVVPEQLSKALDEIEHREGA